MDYIIWTKVGFGDQWERKDTGDKGAVKRLILDELTQGREPILTIKVPFDLQLNVGEPGAEVKNTRKAKETPEEKAKREEAELEADKDKTE